LDIISYYALDIIPYYALDIIPHYDRLPKNF
jgi:hypothetical protein